MRGEKKSKRKPPASAIAPLVTPGVLRRVFHLRCGARKGACFSLDVDERQYLITATHIIRALGRGGVMQVLHAGKWKPLDAAVVGYAPPQVDVAVLALKFRITLPECTLEPAVASPAQGQEAYCLGFPFGEWGGGGNSANNFPLPFVKRVAVSYLPEVPSAVRYLYLDGYGNPGFSGGPVVFREANHSELKVAGVLSAFDCENEPVYLGSEAVHLSGQHNPDIMVAYDIKHALDLITLNPTGFPVAG